MIIGIDATRANKPQKTGVEWYSFFLIREMVAINRAITFRLYFNSDPEPELQNLGPNVEYRIIKWPLVYLWTQIRLSWEILWHQPDVLFIPAQIIPLIHAKNTVTTIHDVAYEVYREDLSWKSRMYLRLAAYLAKWFCRKIITVSEFSKKEIIKYYRFNAERITVIPLAVNPTMNKLPVIADQPPYLLYIGRLESKKNIAQLINVFHQIKQTPWGRDLLLYLAGYPSRGWEEAKQLIAKYSLGSSIKLFGWITEQEKFNLIAGARVYIHLAKYEGFGIGILEAMVCGAPVITNNAASLPEIAGGAALLVNATDTSSVVDAVYQVVSNETVRQRMITAGHERAKTFTWRRTAEATLKVLTDSLS